MTQGTFSASKMLVVGVAGVLLAASQVQAAPPAGGGPRGPGGFPHGPNGNSQVPRFGYGPLYRPGYLYGYGYPGYYGYTPVDYAITANREQLYQSALLLQAQQYRTALAQAQLAAIQQARSEPQRTQPDQAESKRPAPAKATTTTQATSTLLATPEDLATGRLKMAKSLALNGQSADAADYYREIVQKYPGTFAAREALEKLDTSNQR